MKVKIICLSGTIFRNIWLYERKCRLLAKIRHWFKDLPIAIELRNNSWYQPNFVKQMLQFMKENQFSLVIVDEPQIPTNPVPFIRM